MSEIRVGDRVRVRQDIADQYIQPYRGWIENGRLATVLGNGHSLGRLDLKFDCTRKPKRWTDYVLRSVNAQYLTLVEHL